jgi:hypothetical protein
VVAALAVAGCVAGPVQVDGEPAPLTAAAGAPTPSRPAPVVSPSGTAVLPKAYAEHTLARAGVTIRLPVPVGWSLTEKEYGVDFGDPSGRLLLRLDIRERRGEAVGVSAARAWELGEPQISRGLANYRRLGIVAVPGIGDSAADWTFTFERGGVTRQVVDRGISVGAVTVAVYLSAEQQLYDAMLPVFTKAADGLVISGG